MKCSSRLCYYYLLLGLISHSIKIKIISNNRKSYAQVLALFTNIKKILKIKEMFLNLQAKKNENIQKVINNNGKPRSKLNMAMKGLSRKQDYIYGIIKCLHYKSQ